MGIWEDHSAATQFLLRCSLPREFPWLLCWCSAPSPSSTITCALYHLLLSYSSHACSYLDLSGATIRNHQSAEPGESWEPSEWAGNHRSQMSPMATKKMQGTVPPPFPFPCESAGRNKRQHIQISMQFLNGLFLILCGPGQCFKRCNSLKMSGTSEVDGFF